MIISLNGKLKTASAAPYYIGSAGGRRFFENPWMGDEAPLIERVGEGKYVTTSFWELEDACESLPFN